MAPEIIDHNVDIYDGKVDSWSLGVLVCVMYVLALTISMSWFTHTTLSSGSGVEVHS